MRRFLSVFLQFFLFLVTFALGSFLLHPFNVVTVLASDATHTRSFLWDGLLLMLLLYALVLLIEVVMRQIKAAGLWSTIAVVLAGVLGFAMKFGFISTDR
ncbi:hypothetical protein [Granulicella sibirica]|uniref:Uncharacterized protein n=1 Tax=Granulicella sibirica TaxID=2479048 RepID=A0A4Q0SV79_9BACT|nr:hypothetical protein [Granulicella sibirica]RXH54262.1 hypothetical protein GRAN_4558 [Granulicella sibirica]